METMSGRRASSQQMVSVSFREHESAKFKASGTARLDSKEIKRIMAARIIERAWFSYRDRKMFSLLKHATCAAENSLTYEILRKISPKEANLLRDKGTPVKVRFRFGGAEFPPMVFFKIYSDTSMTSVKYISGKKAIKPASKAAEEACDQMGKRKFLEIMVRDTMCQEKYKVTDQMDVTTLKDYMQYQSHVDELPCYMGGKDNSWRKLTLDVIPRQTVFYDIVDFLYHNNMTERLQKELPLLVRSPINAEQELMHIETISRMSTPPMPQHTPKPTAQTKVSSRRSKQAQSRVKMMRKMYGLTTPILDERGSEDIVLSDEDMFNDEADKLFQWTQELSFDELDRVASVQAV